jgi:hypothetical protein
MMNVKLSYISQSVSAPLLMKSQRLTSLLIPRDPWPMILQIIEKGNAFNTSERRTQSSKWDAMNYGSAEM